MKKSFALILCSFSRVLVSPRIITLLLFTITLVGCATSNKILSKEEVSKINAEQNEWLVSLKKGKQLIEVQKHLPNYNHYVFSYYDNESLYTYIRGKYPDTDTLYGLLFEDNQLASLLLDQSVTDFDVCRSKHFMDKDSWPFKGFTETVSWIKLQSMLGSDFSELAVTDSRDILVEDDSSAGETVEIITHLPLAIIAAPAYGLYKLFGSEDQEEDHENKILLSKTTEKELIELYGKPNYRWTHEIGEILQYLNPDAKFGLFKGTVLWSEFNWWGTPTNHRSKPSRSKCIPTADK